MRFEGLDGTLVASCERSDLSPVKTDKATGKETLTIDVSNTDSTNNAFAAGEQKVGATPSPVVTYGSTIGLHPPSNCLCLHPPLYSRRFDCPKCPSTVELPVVKPAAGITVGVPVSIQQAVTGTIRYPRLVPTENKVLSLLRDPPWLDHGACLAENFHPSVYWSAISRKERTTSHRAVTFTALEPPSCFSVGHEHKLGLTSQVLQPIGDTFSNARRLNIRPLELGFCAVRPRQIATLGCTYIIPRIVQRNLPQNVTNPRLAQVSASPR